MESSKLTRRPSKNSTGQTPKRHSARVEKPRSNNQSPRGSERRRTFTAVKQYASLDDHYRKMFGLDDEEEKDTVQQHSATTRPVSWHPSSSQWPRNESTTGSMQWQGHGLQVPMANHGDAMLYQQSNSALDVGSMALYASQVDAAWSSYMHGQTASHTTNQPHQTSTWLSAGQSQTSSIFQSEDQHNHFLPTSNNTQQEGQEWDDSSSHRLVRQKSTELIGLGLYDPPGSTPPPMHMTGKGLKLEETWQPPEDMEDADADEESEDEEEEPPRPEDTQLSQTTLPLVNMAGQSFFFEEDEGLKNEWWYHHLKNPVPQAGTLGYGWI